MPAVSIKQQRLMGAVHAHQAGKLKHPSSKVKAMAGSISEDDAGHFASTKHKGLPMKKKAFDYIKTAAVKLAAVKTATKVAMTFAAVDPRFLKVAADLRLGTGLSRAVKSAFVAMPPIYQKMMHNLIIKAAAARKASDDMAMTGGGGDITGGAGMGGGTMAATGPGLFGGDANSGAADVGAVGADVPVTTPQSFTGSPAGGMAFGQQQIGF